MNGIETVVLRMTNVVGAPEDPDVNCWMLVANSLCREAVTRGSITLRGSGEEFRDFITITDFCRAIDHFLNIDVSDFQPRVFNLGGGCATPVINLAKRIAGRVELLGRPRPLVTRELPRDKPCQFDYRIDNLLKTGFNLRGDLDNEIDETLALCAAAFDII